MKHKLVIDTPTSILGKRVKRIPGFTIVELVVVIVVLAIIATLVIISYDTVTRDSESSAVKADLRNAYAKLKMYRLDNGEYPEEFSGDVAFESTNTSFSYIYGGDSRFCLAGQSPKGPDIIFNIDQSEEIKEGECAPMTGTPEECFAVNPLNGIGRITDYYDTNPVCPSDVVIPDQIGGAVISIVEYPAFRNKGLTSVIIPRAVTTLGQSSFEGNSLSSVTFSAPTSLTTIGIDAFRSQGGNLKKIVIPESVTAIGSNAFLNNTAIKCYFAVGKSYGSSTGCSQILYVN